MKIFGLLMTAFMLFPGPVFAQSVGEKLGVNSTLGIAPKATDFVKEAAAIDMFEIRIKPARSNKNPRGRADLRQSASGRSRQNLKRIAAISSRRKNRIAEDNEQLPTKYARQIAYS